MARLLALANVSDSSSDDDDDRSNHLRKIRRSLRDKSNPFEMPTAQFAQTYRFSQHEAMEIIDMLRPHVRETLRSTKVPLEMKVLL